MNKPEITCDRCIAPGTCCKAFPLSKDFATGTTPEQLVEFLAEQKYPFVPLRRYYTYIGAWLERWLFQCTKLGADGRCTIYEDRPELCKLYEAGCDEMCIHTRGIDGNPIVPLLPIVK